MHAPEFAPELVLDTNVVLDWLVFDDPAMRAMGAEIVAGQRRWIASQPMLDELADVLTRAPFAALVDAGRLDVHGHVARLCQVVPAPATGASDVPLCRDLDDQKFIDLALAHRAPLLLTRDKALLALAKPARACGVQVCTPAAHASRDQAITQ